MEFLESEAKAFFVQLGNLDIIVCNKEKTFLSMEYLWDVSLFLYDVHESTEILATLVFLPIGINLSFSSSVKSLITLKMPCQ